MSANYTPWLRFVDETKGEQPLLQKNRFVLSSDCGLYHQVQEAPQTSGVTHLTLIKLSNQPCARCTILELGLSASVGGSLVTG